MPNQKELADIFNSIAPPREEQWYSLGHCCVFFNCNPGQLEVLMHDAGVSFRRMVDTVFYINGHDLQKLTDAFNRIVTEINDVAESAANN